MVAANMVSDFPAMSTPLLSDLINHNPWSIVDGPGVRLCLQRASDLLHDSVGIYQHNSNHARSALLQDLGSRRFLTFQ